MDSLSNHTNKTCKLDLDSISPLIIYPVSSSLHSLNGKSKQLSHKHTKDIKK